MNLQRSKLMRFDNENLERSSPTQMQSSSVREGLKKVYGKMSTLENWRKGVLIVCVVALGVDPLFLFVPEIDAERFCFTFHKKLAAAVSVIRTVIDTFYVIHIIHQFITEHLAPRLNKSLKGELIVHSKAMIRTRHLFYTVIDILSVLPIPQIVVHILIPRSDALVTKRVLKWIILAQYIPRIIRIYPHYKEVTRDSGRVVETKWIGAAINLFLYILHSYVFGAFWYVSAVEKKNKCWRQVCAKTIGCNLTNLYCAQPRDGRNNSLFLSNSCPLIDPDQITNSTVFNFGMYIDALKSGMVEKEPRDFPRKFFYCFWWGLRNISALGQNLKTSNSVGDVIFAIIICVSGLLLFAVLIGNVQKYLQSITIRTEEMEEKKRDIEKWMSKQKLPKHLQEDIREHVNSKLRETGGVDEESFLRSLPQDLRLKIQSHIDKNMKTMFVYGRHAPYKQDGGIIAKEDF